MEAQFRIRRPAAGLDKQAIDGPGAGFGFQSAAVRLGPLVWISSQVAAPEHRGNAAGEIDDVLAKIATTCANAGTDLSNLLRVRALLSRVEDAGRVHRGVAQGDSERSADGVHRRVALAAADTGRDRCHRRRRVHGQLIHRLASE